MAQTSEEKIQKMIAGQQRSRERAREKARQKLADPAWRQQQRDRAYELAEARAARQREKQKSPNAQAPKKLKKRSPAVAKVRRVSRGTKGRTPTAEEKRYITALGPLPCIACYLHGKISPETSLHHIFGRTAPDCHKKQLPLCKWHHQCAAPLEIRKEYPWLLPVHADGSVGGKTEFERLNGSQQYLLEQTYLMAGID